MTKGQARTSNDDVNYVMQKLRDVPLLERKEELKIATEMHEMRAQWRMLLLGTGVGAQTALTILEAVHREEINAKTALWISPQVTRTETETKKRLPKTIEKIRAELSERVRTVSAAFESNTARTSAGKSLKDPVSRLRLASVVESVPIAHGYFFDMQDTFLRGAYHLLSLRDLNKKKLQALELLELPMGLRDYTNQIVSMRSQFNAKRKDLAAGNSFLAVAIAKKFCGRGLPFIDLIQEGSRGLSVAAYKYEPQRGFRFGTYAGWWVRHYIQRALRNAKPLRVTASIAKTLKNIGAQEEQLAYTLERKPGTADIALALNIPEEDVIDLRRANTTAFSLDTPAGIDDRDGTVADFLPATNGFQSEEVTQEELKAGIGDVLKTLSLRERIIIKLRYGLADGSVHTLDEVGKALHVTRERVRQLEGRAMEKLRQPSRNCKLKGFLPEGEYPYGRESQK